MSPHALLCLSYSFLPMPSSVSPSSSLPAPPLTSSSLRAHSLPASLMLLSTPCHCHRSSDAQPHGEHIEKRGFIIQLQYILAQNPSVFNLWQYSCVSSLQKIIVGLHYRFFSFPTHTCYLDIQKITFIIFFLFLVVHNAYIVHNIDPHHSHKQNAVSRKS